MAGERGKYSLPIALPARKKHREGSGTALPHQELSYVVWAHVPIMKKRGESESTTPANPQH